jgi:MoaA/NifB/PqqE/SkfB family radical SAM enzyme
LKIEEGGYTQGPGGLINCLYCKFEFICFRARFGLNIAFDTTLTVVRGEQELANNWRLNHYQAIFHSLKRLSGIPFTRRLLYLANTFVGETIRIRTLGRFGLRLVEISLTDRCQCRCAHCFASTADPLLAKDELSTIAVLALLDNLCKMWGTEVCFSGGEPLLRNDIIELVNHAHQNGIVARLITNGILLADQLVKMLKDAGLSWCSISIDSPKPEVQDAFRGYSGCFEKAIEGLKLLVEHQIPCSIITVARKDLIYSGELEKIVTLGKNLGVTVVRINFPVPIGRFKNQQEQVLNREEREQVRKLLRFAIVSMEAPNEATKCTAAVTKINILPSGDVTPCVFVPLPYGNIRRQKFTEIWKAMDEYIRQYKINGQCPMCNPFLREKIFDAAEVKAKAPK